LSPFRQNTTATNCFALPRQGDAPSIACGTTFNVSRRCSARRVLRFDVSSTTSSQIGANGTSFELRGSLGSREIAAVSEHSARCHRAGTCRPERVEWSRLKAEERVRLLGRPHTERNGEHRLREVQRSQRPALVPLVGEPLGVSPTTKDASLTLGGFAVLVGETSLQDYDRRKASRHFSDPVSPANPDSSTSAPCIGTLFYRRRTGEP
jgi:hypothetical protein